MKDITPYLTFDGSCREAMTFYQQCLGGELSTMPLENTFWNARFGMLRDRFGVNGMFNYEVGPPSAV